MTEQTTTTTTRVEIRGGELLDALAAIKPSLSRRKRSLPWERCVHLLVGAGEARLECNTGEAAITVDLEGASGSSDVWVDAQDLQRALSTHADRRGARSRVGLELSVTDDTVTVVGPNGSSTVDAADADAMLSETTPARATLVVDRDTFAHDMAAAAVCTESGASALPILTGIYLHDGKIAATDRYRLAYIDMQGTGTLPGVIVPADLAKILKSARGETVSIGTAGDRVTVRAEGLTATLRCVEGQYPKVVNICGNVEHSGAPQANLHREVLVDLLKPFAGGRHVVTFTPDAGHIEITVRETGTGDDVSPAATSRSAMAEGDDLEHPITFNSGYLLEILKVLPGPTVTMRVPAPLKPAGFIGADPHRLMVLQPVRLAS